MSYPFVQALSYTPGPRRGPIDLIVFHDMEAPELLGTAEACAQFFARTTGGSAHYNVDADSIVQSVRDSDIAWGAPGANHNGIHVEHAGYARQSREEWLDDYGLDMLRRSAALVVDLCDEHDVPKEWLGIEALRSGRRGITTHRATTFAYNVRGGHTDPGPDFPVDVYMQFIRDAEWEKNPPPPTIEVPPMYVPSLGPIVAACAGPHGLGALLLGEDAGVYVIEAPVIVPPGYIIGPNGQEFWGDRKPARITFDDTTGRWTVFATTGEPYEFPAPPPA